MGILVDLLSHSTITGFMGGTATIITFQQLKGMLGMTHFTRHTDIISVIRSVIKNRHEVCNSTFIYLFLETREQINYSFWIWAG